MFVAAETKELQQPIQEWVMEKPEKFYVSCDEMNEKWTIRREMYAALKNIRMEKCQRGILYCGIKKFQFSK